MANVIRRLYSPNIRRFLSLSYTSRPLVVLNLYKQTVNRTFCGCKLRQSILSSSCIIRNYSDKISNNEPEKKVSLFKRFKQMYRDYWYVLLPVHIVTSIGWFGGFYYLAKSGIDIVTVMEQWHISEKLINPLKDSSMGYLAISYALYKLATPFRYMVTLGGTTVSIKYLKEWGYIKPVPSPKELRNMYIEKKDTFMEAVGRGKEDFRHQKEKGDMLIGGLEKKIKTKIATSKEQLREKKDGLIEELQKPLKVKQKDH